MGDWWASRDELELLLNLSNVKGIGQVKLRILMANYKKPSSVLSVPINELKKNVGINDKTAHAIQRVDSDKFGNHQINIAKQGNCQIISIWDPVYPDKLKKIPDPPIVLYVRGQTRVFSTFAIAIVGTRVPTTYGKNITIKLTGELVDAGVTIVSGLARGVDTIAHTETCKHNGKTIAVLGSGLDVLYPPENKKLATEICENGAVITEFAFGTQPDAVNFPRRNRIISGLTAGTVVTEAGNKSGALITAYQALEQNREVFAVPGSVFSQKHIGPNRLIKEGAKLVASIDDILEELPAQGDLFSNSEKKTLTINFTGEEKAIVDLLRDGELHIDKMSQLLKRDTHLLLSPLLKLELDGVVQQQPGKIFVLNKRV